MSTAAVGCAVAAAIYGPFSVRVTHTPVSFELPARSWNARTFSFRFVRGADNEEVDRTAKLVGQPICLACLSLVGTKN